MDDNTFNEYIKNSSENITLDEFKSIYNRILMNQNEKDRD